MPLYDPIIAERYFRPMLRALQNAPDELLKQCVTAAGLAAENTFSPTAAITIDRFEAMLAVILSHPEYSSFGFDAGARVSLLDHGPLAPALLRCKTLEERLKLQARYSRIISPIFSLRYTRFADHAEFVMRPTAPFKAAGLRTFLEIYAVAIHTNFPAYIRNPLNPHHIYISIDPPSHIARYKALSGVQFHFVKTGLPEVKIVLPDTMVVAPLHADCGLQPADERAQLDILQNQIGRTTKCSEWARLILSEAEACQPRAQELADLLSVSRRTFERALTCEGVNYRDLSRQVRHKRAREQLRNPELSLSQIAYHLGYGDLAAFSRAFSTMAGASPSDYRKTL